MFHAGILCCAGVQINIQTFRGEFFRSLVDHVECSGHLLSEYMHYHWLPCCISPSDFDVSKTCRDQRSWRFLQAMYARIGHIRL